MNFATEIVRLRGQNNRGVAHVFLKNALAETCDVTTVEAGNIFSPGAWTCGISVVWQTESGCKSPQDLPLEAIEWRFEEAEQGGIHPVLRSLWRDGATTFTHRLTHIGGEGAAGVDYAEIEIGGAGANPIGVLVRDIGPAGGKISSLRWDEENRMLAIGDGPRLFAQSAPSTVEICPVDEDFDAPAALLLWRANSMIKFRVEHAFGARSQGTLAAPAPHGPPQVEAGFARAIGDWKTELPTRITQLSKEFAARSTPAWSTPIADNRIARLWEMCAYHLLAASEAGTARIGAINYPHLWLRDGVLVARAFDLMGRPDLAQRSCDEIAPQIFAGGFGAESDAPGQGIWALVSHARATQDFAWLEKQWPHIQSRLNWIERMIETPIPLRAVGSGRIPHYLDTPAINVVCLASQNGCIAGRMDWHAPDFFINCWNVRGLRDGSEAAKWRGDERAVRHWSTLADVLESAVFENLLPQYGNPRDAIITPYPSETLMGEKYLPALREQFAAWFRSNRMDENDARKRENLWTYFEVAQIHNAFRLGLLEEAWTCLNSLLDDEMETGAWIEGTPNGNELLPFGNGANRRGWLDCEAARGGNMPHGWTCAEIIHLLHFIGG